jgi:hypothetical protein
MRIVGVVAVDVRPGSTLDVVVIEADAEDANGR